jgi:hypothetical protein
MPLSTSTSRNIALAGAVVLCIILLRTIGIRKSSETSNLKSRAATEISDVQASHRKARSADALSSPKSPAEKRRQQHAVAPKSHSGLPEVQGFIIEDFSSWKAIPPGYDADGVKLVAKGITLADDSATTQPRVGFLQSPAMPLLQPAMMAPAAHPPHLPVGAGIYTEISLSADGHSWSPWARLEIYNRPEGTLATPAMQASLAPGSVKIPSYVSPLRDVPSSAPLIRYRLTLDAQSTGVPVVHDLRVWKRTI